MQHKVWRLKKPEGDVMEGWDSQGGGTSLGSAKSRGPLRLDPASEGRCLHSAMGLKFGWQKIVCPHPLTGS